MCYHCFFAKFDTLKNILVDFGIRSIRILCPVGIDRARVDELILCSIWEYIAEGLVQSNGLTLSDFLVVSLMVGVEYIIQCVDTDRETITSPWCKAACEIMGAIVTVIREEFDAVAIDIGRV